MNREQRRALGKVGGGSSDGSLPWAWKEVEISDGRKIRVRAMPPYLADASVAHLKMPSPPIITIPSQLPGGGDTKREDTSDSSYQNSLREWNTERERIIDEVQLAWGVDVDLPDNDDWKEEVTEFIPNVKWGETAVSKKADYIKYVVIQNMQDLLKIKRTVSGMTILAAEVQEVENSFRDQTGGTGSP